MIRQIAQTLAIETTEALMRQQGSNSIVGDIPHLLIQKIAEAVANGLSRTQRDSKETSGSYVQIDDNDHGMK